MIDSEPAGGAAIVRIIDPDKIVTAPWVRGALGFPKKLDKSYERVCDG
jgi:hypothetical protein